MTNRKNIILGIAFLVVFGIAFFAGMEYKAYQIRQAISTVFSGALDAFGGNTKDAKTTPTSNSSVSNDLTKKVELTITKKGFATANYQSQNTFTLQFTNNSGKDIEGVKGVLTINDLFGDTIKQANLSYDEGIKSGESKIYIAGIDYNQFMDEDTKLKDTDLEKIKYDWQVTTIIYTDGTKEEI